MDRYHYTECGLDYVYLLNGFTAIEYGDEIIYAVNNAEGLHRSIGESILQKTSLLTGDEIRFLRKEMDMSQKDIAHVFGNSDQTIANWEKGKIEHTQGDDILIRLHYAEKKGVPKTIQGMLHHLALDEIARLELVLEELQDGAWEPIQQAA